MTDPKTIYYYYDPSSIGWLHRRADNGEEILNKDIVRIIRANPDLILDVVLRDYALQGIEGKLKAKRGPKITIQQISRNYEIVDLYIYYLDRIERRKLRNDMNGRKRARSDMSTTELAQALVARKMGYKGPESIRNLLSSLRNPKKPR